MLVEYCENYEIVYIIFINIFNILKINFLFLLEESFLFLLNKLILREVKKKEPTVMNFKAVKTKSYYIKYTILT